MRAGGLHANAARLLVNRLKILDKRAQEKRSMDPAFELPGDVVALLESKATSEEVEDYRRFVLAVADKVANAHREAGQSVSPAEAQAIEQISAALGASPHDG